MMKLFCAIVGARSAFSVEVGEDQTVEDLKLAIKNQNRNKLMSVDANDLQLFLAKKDKGNGMEWLTQLDVVKGVMDANGFAHLLFVDAKLRAVGLDSSELGKVNDKDVAVGKGHVHVLVVVPKTGVSKDGGRSIQKFSAPIEFSEMEHEGGVPSTFRTERKDTVAAIASLLDRIPVVFFRAPPLSGKTAMCHLLYNHIVFSKPDALVASVRANRMARNETFAEYFKKMYGCDFEEFCAYRCDRVLLIDEAQITYNDEQLWRGFVKDTLESQIPGLRLVLFSSYGSFDVYRKQERPGTPILVPTDNTFGLNVTPSKPGLQLSRVELEEMVLNSIGASVSDLIWVLCSGHIGIARAVLVFLRWKFGSTTPNAEDVEMELRSEELLQYVRASYRGIPTADAFQRIVKNNDLSEETILKMSEVLNGVASGKVTSLHDPDGQQTPRSQTAVELLTKFGFLYEDQAKQLQFASNMHLKIWLLSSRTDPIGYMVKDISHGDFIVACVQRMSASRLQKFATENTTRVARERQIQMELYGATTSCLPKGVLVTPEWRTDDGKGFIDLVIRGSGILWFWELLVNGDDAVCHSKRFETGGTNYGSLTRNCRYMLIDFRQNMGVRKRKDGFLYVSFADSFTKAHVFGLDKPTVSVELLS
eukprot:jgi/Phyca11/563460/estExt2_Genewise1.C_PHYCAscaffold_120265